jgi:protein TonB
MRPLLIFLLIFISLTLSAQDTVIEIKVVKPQVINPEFPGGEAAMMKFIQKNIKYPDMEREADIQGRIIVSFIVNEDGSLSNIYVAKGVSSGIDAEAIRVVKLLPRLKPGKQDGIPVRVQFMLPIDFKLALQ